MMVTDTRMPLPPTAFNTASNASPTSLPPAHISLPDPRLILKREASSSDDGSDTDGSGDSDEANGLVGFSISKTQSHLVNSKTPAVEKASALQEGGDYFAPLDDLDESPEITPNASPDRSVETEANVAAPTSDAVPPLRQVDGGDARDADRTVAGHSSTSSTKLALPSPWIAGPKAFKFEAESGTNDSKHGYDLESDLSRKPLPFGLSSIPNPVDLWHNFRIPEFNGRPRSNTLAERRTSNRLSDHFSQYAWNRAVEATPSSGSPNNRSKQSQSITGDSTPVTKNETTSTPRGSVASSRIPRRRSEESISLHRAMSTASSLGDDSRFEHISEMVNSRMKAIKDSFGDTRIPRPSLPTIPKLDSLKLSHARTDLDDRSRNRLSDSHAKHSRASTMNGVSRSEASRSSDGMPQGTSANQLEPTSGSISAADAALYPHFTRAFSKLTGDLVILGGYRGSILRETQEPCRRLWITTKAGLNVRKVDLEVGLEDEDEERMPEKIYASGMLTHIGPVDISRRLLKRLRSCENAQNGSLRIHEYAYDWRLSPHRLSKQLLAFIESLPSNQPDTPVGERGVFVIAHSLGGLITRHAVNERPELFSGVVFAGSPHRCVNILGPIRNGDQVLFSSKVLTAQVNFTIRTSFALLPLDGYCFIDKDTKEEYPVDFFDINQWIEYRWSPCVGTVLPALVPQKTGLSSMFTAASAALPNIPDFAFLSRRKAESKPDTAGSTIQDAHQVVAASAKTVAAATKANGGTANLRMTPQMSESPPVKSAGKDNEVQGTATDISISREAAIKYLTRTLAEVKRFKQELSHKPEHTEANTYPPLGVIYGKSEPTVYAARVAGRDGIKRADAYDNLAFASGDGVVLAKSAMLPDGYRAVKGGVVATEKGHVSLLADLEAVGKAVGAVLHARRRGTGTGT